MSIQADHVHIVVEIPPQIRLKKNSFAKKPDRLDPTFIFDGVLHCLTLLPFGMGKSLGDAISVCDVLAEIP